MKRTSLTLLCSAFIGFAFLATPVAANCGSCGADSEQSESAKKECQACKESGQLCAACAEKVQTSATTMKKEGSHSEEGHEHGKKKEAKVFWGNEKCPIMGGKVNPASFVAYSDPKTHTYGKVYVCCSSCMEKVKADKAAVFQKVYLDPVIKNEKGKVIAKKGEALDLKNKTCPISGGKVSGKNMLVYNGYKIGLCCPKCEKAFVKDADKKLTALVVKEKIKIPGKKIAQVPPKSAAAEKK